jgi:IclR family transcriptional regulator, acetate operon repressor
VVTPPPTRRRSGTRRGPAAIAHPSADPGPGTANNGGTESADRVADVLGLFTTGAAALGVSQIARELGLGKAVVHRILQSLASRSFVEPDPQTRGYRLGPGAVALGARALRDLDLRSAARPVLSRLRDETRETTTLSAPIGPSRVYLDQYESPQEIKMMVELGRPYPLHAGASSRAILAFLPEEIQEEVINSDLPRLTAETISEPTTLRRRLAEIRSAGYATSRGERQHGAGAVAAPVFGMDGEIAGAISVCGPVARFDADAVERYVPLVCQGARDISRSLGSSR